MIICLNFEHAQLCPMCTGNRAAAAVPPGGLTSCCLHRCCFPAGVSSASLASQGFYAPTIQAFLSYCLLAAVYGSAQLLLPLIQQLLTNRQAPAVKYSGLRTASSSGDGNYSGRCSRQCSIADSNSCQEFASHTVDNSKEGSVSSWQRMRKMWPAFAALALIDVEANVLVSALQYACAYVDFKSKSKSKLALHTSLCVEGHAASRLRGPSQQRC
jgi:hypothetical protein